MKISALAKRTGLSVHTLRYYERIGLIPPVFRDTSGQRDYDESALSRLEFLGKLKTTGMPLSEILNYVELVTSGAETVQQRRAILIEHREKVRRHVAELNHCLLVLDKKIDGYINHQIFDKTGES